MTGYKRANLIFSDLDRLKAIAERFGGLQWSSRVVLTPVTRRASLLPDPDHCSHRTQSPWASLPTTPCVSAALTEESTSTQPGTPWKQAAQAEWSTSGVPNLNIPDGWWVEGDHMVNGWSSAKSRSPNGSMARASKSKCWADESLYEVLESVVMPLVTNQIGHY